ncbi:hypothetical protein [Streptomyces goshikiensis]|uniref:hypothetical protein n=1 Tax=Streptomyces goshikiensis TaxID=1942 RepID=UPI00331EF624
MLDQLVGPLAGHPARVAVEFGAELVSGSPVGCLGSGFEHGAQAGQVSAGQERCGRVRGHPGVTGVEKQTMEEICDTLDLRFRGQASPRSSPGRP